MSKCSRKLSMRPLSAQSNVVQVSTSPKKKLDPKVDVQQGDLIKFQTDAIAAPSSSEFLREKILRAGGDAMRTAYEIAAKEDSVIIVSTDGSFQAEKVFFLPFQSSNDENALRSTLENFVSTAVENAFVRNYHSIAFPAVGCGLFGCPVGTVAEAMVEAAYQQSAKYAMSVTFVIEPTRTNVYEEFQRQVVALNPHAPTIPSTTILSVSITNGIMEIVTGDLITEEVDAIVADALSKTLITKILRRAGNQALEAYKKSVAENPNADIIVVPAGQLRCQTVLIAKWQWNQDKELLQQSIINFMNIIVQHVIASQYKSIAISINTGENQAWSTDLVAKTMIDEIIYLAKRCKLTLKVRLVFDPSQQDVHNAFCTCLQTWHDDSIRPSTWESCTDGRKRFEVSKTSDEFKTVVASFNKTMKDCYQEIIRVERIQNERWYKQYLAHNHDFRKRLNADTERRLYHGCDETAVDSIIEYCFNRSFAGKNATLYGVGVYFSANALFSNAYANPNRNGERHMFYSRVLIGNTTCGNGSMKTPPAGFDSTTDGNHIFVTYHDAQAYAEYLIVYR